MPEYVDRVEINGTIARKMKLLKDDLLLATRKGQLHVAGDLQFSIKQIRELFQEIQKLPTLRTEQIAREPLLAAK